MFVVFPVEKKESNFLGPKRSCSESDQEASHIKVIVGRALNSVTEYAMTGQL